MAVQARCPGYGPGDGYERHLFTANGELRSSVCLRCGARGQVMNEATIGVWGWSREKKTKDIVIHGPSYPENSDTCDIVLADGVYLSEDDAARIVRDHNTHNVLVEGLEYVVLKAACGASSHELSQAAQAVLDKAK